jgi:hypothetical protein
MYLRNNQINGKNRLKKFAVDCNFNFLGPSYPALSNNEVKKLDLSSHEHVIVFQDDDQWEGEVLFDPSLPEMYQWYVKI